MTDKNTNTNLGADTSANLHGGHRERLRARYLNHGGETFADHELLELLLFYAIPRRDTNKLAHQLIRRFGSLHALMNATPQQLMQLGGVGDATAVLLSSIRQFGKRLESFQPAAKPVIPSASVAGNYLVSFLDSERSECFCLLCLDLQKHLLCTKTINRGTIDEVRVYPRTVVETALQYPTAYVIIAHNHPSGQMGASSADTDTTTLLIRLLKPMNITLLDHIIVGNGTYFSFSENMLVGLANSYNR